MTKPLAELPESQSPVRIADRYDVLRQLGRGGMAAVYLVRDAQQDQTFALKQLRADANVKAHAEAAARFEREYRTLSELTHPQIVRVFDYGRAAAGPFYTMEVLEHGDLVDRAPMPWRAVCLAMHELCSSLALLHARRLVHCDISPRNVRFTAAERTKLIDFGAMVPMGRDHMVVGTPAFIAPETLARSELDAATDLYSLAATFYFALTGKVPFAARDFSQLRASWLLPPPPPSQLISGIPPALDRLLLSLLSLDAAERPRSTFEVMQRLEACAGLDRVEPTNVGAAYLSSPLLIGRKAVIQATQQVLDAALGGRGRALLVRGAPGTGRSRVLSAAAMAAKLRAINVLRVDAAAERDFAGAQALCEQLLELLPEAATAAAQRLQLGAVLFDAHSGLRDMTQPDVDRPQLQAALYRWLIAVGEVQPLLIAIDDLQRLDAPSTGLLAQLAADSQGARICMALTIGLDSGAALLPETNVLVRRAHVCELSPLNEAQTAELLTSVFGDVPHVHVIGHAIHTVAGGNPKLCMELARHLVASGTVRYDGGQWSLPARVAPNDIPESVDAALRARVLALRPLARRLLEAQALTTHQRFTRDDYTTLAPEAAPQQIDEAILELIAQGLVSAIGTNHQLVHRNWALSLTSHLQPDEKRARHAAIAALYADRITSVFHHFAAGHEEQGLTVLLRQLNARGDTAVVFANLGISAWELGKLFERALEVSERLQRSPRETYDVLRWLVAIGVVSEDRHYWDASPKLLPMLRELSCVADYARLSEISDPQARLQQALRMAFERFQATHERERISSPPDAIRHLATYVATSIPLAARSGRLDLLGSLAALIEPLLSLSPALRVIYDNAMATRELCVFGRVQRAHDLWLDIHGRFESEAGAQLGFIEVIRDAITCAIGSLEVQLGLTSALPWTERLDKTEYQAAAGMELRKLIALQAVDWERADHFRKRAEYVSLQQRVRPMFSNLLLIELEIYSCAQDLSGLRDLLGRLARVAEQYSYWNTPRLLCEASYERCRGRPKEALAVVEQCLRECDPACQRPNRAAQVWPLAAGVYVELLVDLEQVELAVALGLLALVRCEEEDVMGSANLLVRAVALAEATTRDFARANKRLADRIAQNEQRGVCQLYQGALYEARAYAAIWQGDAQAFEQYRDLTAQAFQPQRRSALSVRYKRLLDEKRARLDHPLGPQHGVATLPTQTSARKVAAVQRLFRRAKTAEARAELTLTLLCKDRGASSAHLFLVREAAPDLAASVGNTIASEELREQAQAFLRHRLTDDTCETRQFADPADLDDLDTQPNDHPVWVALDCNTDGGTRLVAVVSLYAAASGILPTRNPELTGALALALLTAGDTSGAPVP